MTYTQPKQMHLGVVLSPTTAHVAGWRHPDAISNAGATFEQLRQIVDDASRAKFDFAFLADELCAPDATDEILSRDPVVYQFEPLTLMSALAVTTKEIGLVATQTTTYNEPYHIARKLASIDNLSGGRCGWNVVTSYVPAEARNFNLSEHVTYENRYERAREFCEVTAGLWDSWTDDAFVLDKESGRYFDPERIRRLNHEGKHFKVAGPLNVVRSPQGHPVIVQAGSSEHGLDLAADVAEMVFTAQRNLDGAVAFNKGLRERAERRGRDANSFRVIAGVYPVIGGTMEEAKRKYSELQDLIHSEIGLARLSQLLDFDVTNLPLDGPLPDNIPVTNAYRSRQELIINMAREGNMTLRELYKEVMSAYGHRIVIGTPETVADSLQEWHAAGASDGFMIMPAFLPTGLTDFVDGVVPELRKRDLFRTEYEGNTLRSHLGIARPDVPSGDPALV
ncbi:LLM class flavin-dependent oxidoreductase [Rhodococcus pseudokoreensis]|uniref:LLM class flavin-dependent oxidoreductase n=1 Tax=Rhodococcus pseudokoreensis TaxID=2811421 RepID=A0A974ZU58_9NOCA|nr:LLM class flavin-dependent oxidoreductase [Rhodococcus pseudokoreensis]QSE90531.1 LLM class flavin-dependent oxidoreductase [Rhodococcus pseudokoreensis]